MLVIQTYDSQLLGALIGDWPVVILWCYLDNVAKGVFVTWAAILSITTTNESGSSLQFRSLGMFLLMHDKQAQDEVKHWPALERAASLCV